MKQTTDTFQGTIVKHNGGDWGPVALCSAFVGDYAFVKEDWQWANEHIGERVSVKIEKGAYKTVKIVDKTKCNQDISHEKYIITAEELYTIISRSMARALMKDAFNTTDEFSKEIAKSLTQSKSTQ